MWVTQSPCISRVVPCFISLLQRERVEAGGAEEASDTIFSQHEDSCWKQKLVVSQLGQLEGEAPAGQVRARQEASDRQQPDAFISLLLLLFLLPAQPTHLASLLLWHLKREVVYCCCNYLWQRVKKNSLTNVFGKDHRV